MVQETRNSVSLEGDIFFKKWLYEEKQYITSQSKQMGQIDMKNLCNLWKVNETCLKHSDSSLSHKIDAISLNLSSVRPQYHEESCKILETNLQKFLTSLKNYQEKWILLNGYCVKMMQNFDKLENVLELITGRKDFKIVDNDQYKKI